MTAAIFAARANLKTAIVEEKICGGLANWTSSVENFPSHVSINGMELMAGKGVIPILRKVSPHPLRKGDIRVENVSAGRLLSLAGEHRRVLEKHGLDVMQALTGCLPCTGCDVSPIRDV